MIDIYLSNENELQKLDEPTAGCWVELVSPNRDEIVQTCENFKIDEADLRAALDREEGSRISTEDGYVLVIVDIPTTQNHEGKDWWTTIPLGIILCEDAVITICSEPSALLAGFENGRVSGFKTFMKTRFVLQLLYNNARLYIGRLHQINKMSNEIERKLHHSTRNKELLELMELERSLVYFGSSLKANEIVLEKLIRIKQVKKYPEDDDLLQDAIIENKQAMEMSSIYGTVLSGMMDAFASVIANNQNIIMKTLALITIMMSIPTMIFSAYGMNLNPSGMPLSSTPYGFIIVLGASLILAVVVLIIFRIKKWF